MQDDWLSRIRTDLSSRFRGRSRDRIVFLGVGNRMRGDDGIGPVFIDMLKDQVPHAIDASYLPENYTSVVKRLKPEVVVLIDAVKFEGMPPGYAQMLEIEDVEKIRVSAHNFSLDVIMGYLKEETSADVFMIGVQPGSITDIEELTAGMEASLQRLAGIITDLIKK